MKTEMPSRTTTTPARLLIVDDHELARVGLRSMLAREPDLEVVGEAANGAEALALCERLHPDLVLMDVRMPQMDGLEATRAIHEAFPEIGIVIITTYDDPDYLFRALKAGAAGYVLKDARRELFLTTVRQVLDGAVLLNPALMTNLLQRLANDTASPVHPPPEQLTARELGVLRLLAQGYTNGEIANMLHLSVGTVKVHVAHIIAKLGATDRTQAAVLAHQNGLLGAPPSPQGNNSLKG